MNIGAAKFVAVASAMGKKRSEEMNRIDEVTRERGTPGAQACGIEAPAVGRRRESPVA